MPKEGLEPSCTCVRQILSLLRLPIPPLRLILYKFYQHHSDCQLVLRIYAMSVGFKYDKIQS